MIKTDTDIITIAVVRLIRQGRTSQFSYYNNSAHKIDYVKSHLSDTE